MLRKFLAKFPMAGRYWKYLCELDQEAGDSDAVDGYLKSNLERCASVELWRYCVGRERDRLNDALPESRTKMVALYEKALSNVGFNIHAGVLWDDYVNYVQSWEEKNASDTGSKVSMHFFFTVVVVVLLTFRKGNSIKEAVSTDCKSPH